MLAGSTLGLRFSPASSTLPCRLRQAQLLFARGKFAQNVGQPHCQVVQKAWKGVAGGKDATAHRRVVSNSAGRTDSASSAPTPSLSKWTYGTTESGSLSLLGHAKDHHGDGDTNDGHASPNAPSSMSGHQRQPPLRTIRPRFQKRTPLSDAEKSRQKLLHILLTTPTVPKAWAAYEDLVSQPHDPCLKPIIPYGHLHRLARLLASSKPRTRILYLQLSSVLTTLRRTGGRVHTWEWNALIDCAGKHWRKTSMADYKAALDIFHDMSAPLRTPGDSTPHDLVPDESTGPHTACSVPARPDIATYTTLLSIAARSKQTPAVRHALNLLRLSGLPANRLTHLSILNTYSRLNRLSGIRSTLRKMDQQGMEVGIDGLNACIWAFANNGRIDVASAIYRVLRNSVIPENNTQEGDVVAAQYLREVEHLDIPLGIVPDEITYTAMIQCLAYQGHMMQALNVFVDMLSTPRDQRGASVHIKQAGVPVRYPPSMATFRAIFLGFFRHTRRSGGCLSVAGEDPSRSPWNLENLKLVFTAFMELPKDIMPSDRTLYWIIIAFGRVSENDAGVMREVWEQLEGKYGQGWSYRLQRIRKAIYSSCVDVTR
ncbi:hypothetical protein ID866_1182 [Astraeus odoratus]|nr:hypothetical protein ID866_1182 [Astraeus odoratus]